MIALVLGTLGCPHKSTLTKAPASVTAVFPAARFVPAQPTYVVSARTMRDAQSAFTSVIDMLGMAAGFEISEASRELSKLLGVDPMSADAVAAIGVDLEGSVAVFSEGVNPTFVVHLKSAEAMTGFLEGQRQRGMRTQSVISGGTEVFTARLASDAHISWALDKDWMWIHFSFGGADNVDWFENSKEPTGAGWVDGWKWAEAAAAKADVVGVLDLQGVFGAIATRAPEALACGRQLAAVKRVGFNFDIEPKRIAAQLTFDLGAAGKQVEGVLLPPPPGWITAGTNAPIAAAVNVDLPVAAAWLEVCSGDDDFRVALDEIGVRSFRAFLHSLDPDENEGVGAVAADLNSARYFRTLLDRIPGRSMAESARTFGQYKGKHISVPFVGKGDYVLTDQLAIGAMGDGVLARVGTPSSSVNSAGNGAALIGPPPILALDVRPPGLAADVWQFLVEQLELPEPKRLVQRLLLWNELHLGAHLTDAILVIEAHGNRR